MAYSTLQSGKLRYLVTIEQVAGTQDATGQEQWTWQTFTQAYVSIEELSGQERLVAQQLYAGVNIRMRMRYQSGIVPKMRVTQTGTATIHYDIQAALDPDGRQRQLELLCTQRVEATDPLG